MAETQLKEFQVVGKGRARVDGPLKVTGRAMYASDHSFPGMLYAVPVGATIAKGTLASVDTSAAAKMPGVRAVQFTPPGSKASIQFGSTGASLPGPLQNLFLVVDDIVAARDELVSRGVEVSDFFHLEIGKGPVPGLDPNRTTYASRATFVDPDGNTWVLQEITDRLPGRV